jgi:hypothetical protein
VLSAVKRQRVLPASNERSSPVSSHHEVGQRQNIVAFDVKVLDVPDHHLYFQAPGGQVFRLVGINEDLSRYDGKG